MASKVFFTRASIKDGQKKISEKAAKLFKAGGFAGCFKKNDFTAIKVHVGEDGNNTYIKPGCIKGLVDELLALKTKPFVTDTTTLYVGQRHNAIDHTACRSINGQSPRRTRISSRKMCQPQNITSSRHCASLAITCPFLALKMIL